MATSAESDTNIYNFRGLNYSNPGGFNFPHEVRQVELLPTTTFSASLGSGDVVRFNMPSEDLFDPYSTFMEITVDVSQNANLLDGGGVTNKILQLDGSASSFIGSMVVSLRDKEIERIAQYDMLANFLKDISYDNSMRAQKDYEGNGGTSSVSYQNPVLTTGLYPLANSGNVQPVKGYHPMIDQFSYNDTNARTQQMNTASPYGNFTTRNFANNYTQHAFTPYYSTAATTWANQQDEIANNPSDLTRVSQAGAYTLGLTHAYNPSFANNNFEPWFSRTVPLRYLKSGFVKVDLPTTQTFQVPLLSSFFGHLLPPDQWKLIPLKYFKGLVFEFTLNPHAMFTSFFSTDQSSRGYIVKKFSMRTQIVKITDEKLNGQIEAEYQQNGIRLASQAFFYGPNFTIPASGAIPSNLLVNLGFESLRNIFIMFVPNDYTMNTAFRKHYRLSMAITSLQLMMGTQYYPQQPITGNGGTNFGIPNNNEFVKYLWKCFGKHCGQSAGTINLHNFAINCREADPTTTGDTAFIGDPQLSHFMENRILGKCVYGIPLDPMNYDGKMWSGVNTTKSSPFQINMTYDNTKTFPRVVTMHTWMHHDYMLVVTPTDVMTIGRR